MKLLCLSNGHGEDIIACRIATALRYHPHAPEVVALPIVGVGHAYQRAGVTIVGPTQAMPSGGFVNRDGRQLARDVQAGLVQLTLAQLRTVKDWKNQGGMVLAIGDIVPLLLAWLSGAPYAFVGTAKSDYHLRDEITGIHPDLSWFEHLERLLGGVYLPWERWLMSRPQCKAVFPRDRITTATLQRHRIPAIDLGNPMMDGLEMPEGEGDGEMGKWGVGENKRISIDPNPSTLQPASDAALTILLLPGSRIPEAYANWRQILQAVQSILAADLKYPLRFLGAIAPSLPLDEFSQPLTNLGWQPDRTSPMAYYSPTAHSPHPTLHSLTLTAAFSECLQQADVAIAMAGTATEQFVGLGKPAITMPGRGPQFTQSFALAQAHLLGCSVIMVPHPEAIAPMLQRLLKDPDRWQTIAENGRQRMGAPGAAARIATHLLTLQNPSPA